MGLTRRRFDFELGGHGYILSRQQGGARSWNRTGRPDTPSSRSQEAAKYGQLPPEIDQPEVWDDWSGGFGYAYRRSGENTYHWGENIDARFPRQLTHAQQLNIAPAASFNVNCNGMSDIPWSACVSGPPKPDVPGVIAYGLHWLGIYTPFPGTITLNFGMITASVDTVYTIGDSSFTGRGALVGSYYWLGRDAVGVATLNNTSWLWDDGVYNAYIPANSYITSGDRVWRFSRRYKPQAQGGARNNLQSASALADLTNSSNWTGTLNIGNNADDILDFVSLDDQIFAGTQAGLFAGDQSGTFYNVLSEVGNQRHPDNCRDLTIHNGAVIAPHIAGLFSYRPGFPVAQVAEISPQSRSNRSPVRGHIRTVRSFGKWLYAGLYTGSQSYILAGREDAGGFAWHPMQRLPQSAKISRMHFDGITTTSGNAFRVPNRMWISTEATIDAGGTAPLYWLQVPMNNDNPLASDPVWSANYVGSARIDLGAVDFGAPTTPKVYRSVEVTADTLLSGYRYGDIYYDVDQSGSFTLLGRVQTSPVSTLFFPSGEGSYVTGNSIALSLQSFTASPALTPVYKSIVLRSSLRPNSIDEITAVVRTADGMRDRQGGEMRSAASMLAELRSMAASDTPHKLIDLTGAPWFVDVLPPINEHETYQVGEDAPEVAATVRMSVMTFS